MPEYSGRPVRGSTRLRPPPYSTYWSAAWAVFAPLTLFLPAVAGTRSGSAVLPGVLLLGGGSGLLLGILLGYLGAWTLLGLAAGLCAALFLVQVLWLDAPTGGPAPHGLFVGAVVWPVFAGCAEVPLFVGVVLGQALRHSCEARWQRPTAGRQPATRIAGPGPGPRHRWTRPALWTVGSAAAMWLPWFFGMEDMAGGCIMLTLLLLAVPAALLGWSVARHGEWLPLVALAGGTVAMPLSLMSRYVGAAAGDQGPGAGEVLLELVLVAGLITGLPMVAGAVTGAVVRHFRPNAP
ncbi:hypothetical protein [Streptomyces sp. NRRL B-24484]|uniref:hypothetical protein n=1 Tax=Streptomyces sp. NRRL B-24484 TaxID=1463833 RepID=UPI0004BFE51D|nr:hypothetical protein [Streptomyces sp. NRRL B-24484]